MYKNKHGRICLRAAAFLLVLFLVMQAVSWVLVPKTNTKDGGMHNYRSRGFYGEAVNSLDVVAIGNSDLYSAFSPMEVWEKYGISAYACGEIKQQVNQAVYLLKEVLTCQKPKVVILEVDSLFQESLSVHAASMFKAAMQYVFPVIEHHDRWKSLSLKELMGGEQRVWHDPAKGYYFSGDTVPYKGGDYMQDTKKGAAIDSLTAFYLDDFISICKEKDIEVLFVEMPSANSWNQERHQAVAEYAGQHDVTFIDFNTNMEKTGFNWMTDSRDGGNHLNHRGARKISGWLGSYLSTHYGLSDHRTETAYAQWNRDLEEYKKQVKK